MLFNFASAVAAKWVVAIVASLGGGDGTTSQCIYDVKHVGGSSECESKSRCVNVDCCLTENVIPPHDELVPGNKRIYSDSKFSGWTIYRWCNPPVVLFGIHFGWWTCEMESMTPFGEYHQFTLAPCPERKDAPTSSVGGELGRPE